MAERVGQVEPVGMVGTEALAASVVTVVQAAQVRPVVALVE